MENKINKINGVISAHGCLCLDNSYIIIPPELDYILPLSAENTNLSFDKGISNLDMECLYSKNERALINISDFFETKPYLPGYVMKNVTLVFCVEWDDGDCHDTGIFTTGNFRGNFKKKKHFEHDDHMQQELMLYHDKDIYSNKELWRKKKKLGEILDQIVKSGKTGGYIGVFCRGPSRYHIDSIPKFVTIDLSPEIYYSNFYHKLEEMESCVAKRNFYSYTMDIIKPSKLKSRITFDEICKEIRQKLTHGCTISSYNFHSVVQIYHSKIIPIECILQSLQIKFQKLTDFYRNFDNEKILLEADIVKSLFKKILLHLYKKIQSKLYMLAMSHPDQLDIVIYVSEKILEGITITKHHSNDIMKFAKVLGVNAQLGFYFVF